MFKKLRWLALAKALKTVMVKFVPQTVNSNKKFDTNNDYCHKLELFFTLFSAFAICLRHILS